MVTGRMGLLDDAIREHLELKRLKGADSQEIARDERDALGSGSAATVDSGESSDDLPLADADARPRPEAPPAAHGRGQETVELDMDAVLTDEQEDITPAGARGEPLDEGRRGALPSAPDPQDSLEWEMPGEAREDGDGGEAGLDGEEPVEDVLEETPDFLRETPEQERLWFEQRPPRDFDFNE